MIRKRIFSALAMILMIWGGACSDRPSLVLTENATAREESPRGKEATEPAAAKTQASPIITLEKPVHFIGADDRDILALPGTYRLEATEEGHLRMVPTDEGPDRQPLVLNATQMKHDDPTGLPRSMAIPKGQNGIAIALLLPGGTGLLTEGSDTGVRSRGLTGVVYGHLVQDTSSGQKIYPGQVSLDYGSNVYVYGNPCTVYPDGAYLCDVLGNSQVKVTASSYGSRAVSETVWVQSNQFVYMPFCLPRNGFLRGDTNGDGKTDFVRAFADPARQNLITVQALFPNSDGSWSGARYESQHDRNMLAHSPLVGDVNNDGRTDLIFVYPDLQRQNLITVRTFLSVSQTIRLGTINTWSDLEYRSSSGSSIMPSYSRRCARDLRTQPKPILIGDVNKDGKTDLIFVYPDSARGNKVTVRTWLSRGDGMWDERPYLSSSESNVLAGQTLLGDVNGDGMKDVVFLFDDSYDSGSYRGYLNIRTFFSRGDGSWDVKDYRLGNNPADAYLKYAVVIGDVNSDGRADLAFVRDWDSRPVIETVKSNGDGTWTLWIAEVCPWTITDLTSLNVLTPHKTGNQMDEKDLILLGRYATSGTIPPIKWASFAYRNIPGFSGIKCIENMIPQTEFGLLISAYSAANLNGDNVSDFILIFPDWRSTHAGYLTVRSYFRQADDTWIMKEYYTNLPKYVGG